MTASAMDQTIPVLRRWYQPSTGVVRLRVITVRDLGEGNLWLPTGADGASYIFQANPSKRMKTLISKRCRCGSLSFFGHGLYERKNLTELGRQNVSTPRMTVPFVAVYCVIRRTDREFLKITHKQAIKNTHNASPVAQVIKRGIFQSNTAWMW